MNHPVLIEYLPYKTFFRWGFFCGVSVLNPYRVSTRCPMCLLEVDFSWPYFRNSWQNAIKRLKTKFVAGSVGPTLGKHMGDRGQNGSWLVITMSRTLNAKIFREKLKVNFSQGSKESRKELICSGGQEWKPKGTRHRYIIEIHRILHLHRLLQMFKFFRLQLCINSQCINFDNSLNGISLV